jgi:hypothetical protein
VCFERVVVGVPAGTPPLADIDGLRVAVRQGDPVAAKVVRKGGVPVASDNGTSHAAAVPEWQLDDAHLVRTAIELDVAGHVLATPPGENGWIKWLDEFLSRQRPRMPAMLQRTAASQ